MEWQFPTKPTPSPAKVKPSLEPSPLESSRKLVYSPFLSAVAGKCEWSRLRTEPTPYSCFRIQMASIPAVILKKSSKSLSFSKRYRDLYCPRHRDPHTGDTAAHGAFCRIRRAHGLPRKKSPQTADTGGRRRSMQQCRDIRKLQS